MQKTFTYRREVEQASAYPCDLTFIANDSHLPPTPVSRTRNEWNVIAEAMQYARYLSGNSISIPLHAKNYTGTGLNVRHMRKLIDTLVNEMGWKLTKGNVIDWSMENRDCFTKTILTAPRDFDFGEDLQEYKKKLTMRWGMIRNSKGNERPIYKSMPDYHYINDVRNRMRSLNEVTIDWGNRIHHNLSRGIGFIQQRIYNRESTRGGRMYHVGGGLQTMRRVSRKKIVIDSMATTELDYSAMHPNILIQMHGDCSTDFDPYDFDMAGLVIDDEECDKFFSTYGYIPNVKKWVSKMAMLISLNASSRKDAVAALRKRVWDTSSTTDGALVKTMKHDTVLLGKIIDNMLEHNKSIEKFFFTGYGMELQRMDGDISHRIQERVALDMGECIIGIHDSFIVKESLTIKLLDIMREEWFNSFKKTNRCFIMGLES